MGCCYKAAQHSIQTTYRSPTGNEKQIDYILIKRRHLKYNKDAEANDMIHMGSDHRCVMATFTITMLGKNSHYKTMKGKYEKIKHQGRDQTGKMLKLRRLSSKKDTKRSSKKSKEKTAAAKSSTRSKKVKILKRKHKKLKAHPQKPC